MVNSKKVINYLLIYFFLGFPAILGLSKILIFNNLFSEEEFGNYALSLLYGGLLIYLIGPGAETGILRYINKIYVKENKNTINELRKSFTIFLIFSVPFGIIGFLLIFNFGILELHYVIFSIATGLSVSSFNVIAIRWRIYGSFYILGVMHSLRVLIISFPLYISFFYDVLKIKEILLYESILGFSFVLILAFSYNLFVRIDIKNDFKNYYRYTKIGFTISFGALIKQSVFSLERTMAKIFLQPLEFGLYSQAMIIFQASLLLGSIIFSPIQRQVLILVESDKFLSAKNLVIKTHLLPVIIILITNILLWNLLDIFIIKFEWFPVNKETFLIILFSSVFLGFSFYDSLILALGKGKEYIINLLFFIGIALIITIFLIYLFENEWKPLYQSFILLLFTISLSGAAFNAGKK